MNNFLNGYTWGLLMGGEWEELASQIPFNQGKTTETGTSLVAQWLRIRLPMQGTRVWALVQEDPTCRGATKLVCHNYCSCALEPPSHNYWTHVPQLLKPTCLEPVLRNKRSHPVRSPRATMKSSPCLLQLEKAHAQQWRPNSAKNKK